MGDTIETEEEMTVAFTKKEFVQELLVGGLVCVWKYETEYRDTTPEERRAALRAMAVEVYSQVRPPVTTEELEMFKSLFGPPV